MSDLNQRLHEALGHCYHDWQKITVDLETLYECRKCGVETWAPYNPDYVADPRLVLREMRKREDWEEFCESNRWIWANYMAIKIDVMLDTTGKLAQLALDWITNGEEGK
jgi:hypothetical protein